MTNNALADKIIDILKDYKKDYASEAISIAFKELKLEKRDNYYERATNFKSVKEEVYNELFAEYKEISSLDHLSIKYIFETWKMNKEMYEIQKNSNY